MIYLFNKSEEIESITRTMKTKTSGKWARVTYSNKEQEVVVNLDSPHSERRWQIKDDAV